MWTTGTSEFHTYFDYKILNVRPSWVDMLMLMVGISTRV